MDRYLGESIPKLGFGFMRLPTLGDSKEIDQEQVNKLVDYAIEHGVTDVTELNIELFNYDQPLIGLS